AECYEKLTIENAGLAQENDYLFQAAKARFIADQNEKASLHIKRLMLDFPDSRHRLDAYKLGADMAFKQGQIEKARNEYEGLLSSPQYNNKSAVIYQLYLLESDAGANKKAEEYRNMLLSQYTGSLEALKVPALSPKILVPDSLKDNKPVIDSGCPEGICFTIQFGAFSSKTNARKYHRFLSKKLKDLRIVERFRNQRNLFLVWSKDFATEEDARSYLKEFYLDSSIKYVIVKALP
ncbi:MAG: SPOR domain-containing protein, partial [bacterium]